MGIQLYAANSAKLARIEALTAVEHFDPAEPPSDVAKQCNSGNLRPIVQSANADEVVSEEGNIPIARSRQAELIPRAKISPLGNSYFGALPAGAQIASHAHLAADRLEASNARPIQAESDLSVLQRRFDRLELALHIFHTELDDLGRWSRSGSVPENASPCSKT